MCECGCTYGNKAYTLPGPKGTVYVLIFQPACSDCDGPDAVIVQRWPNRKALRESEFDEIPELPVSYHCQDRDETLIVTGRTHEEFVKDLREHLVGLNTADFMGDDGDSLDVIAADEVLSEMYGDSTYTPRLIAEREAASHE